MPIFIKPHPLVNQRIQSKTCNFGWSCVVHNLWRAAYFPRISKAQREILNHKSHPQPPPTSCSPYLSGRNKYSWCWQLLLACGDRLIETEYFTFQLFNPLLSCVSLTVLTLQIFNGYREGETERKKKEQKEKGSKISQQYHPQSISDNYHCFSKTSPPSIFLQWETHFSLRGQLC